MSDPNQATTTQWGATCKDCRNRRAAVERHGEPPRPKRRSGKPSKSLSREQFDYPDDAVRRVLERGGSRSDRCPECRRLHRESIRAFPVAYVDIESVGKAYNADHPDGPSGPLGGLGPLPELHSSSSSTVDIAQFEMGMEVEDSLALLELVRDNQVVILEAGTGTGKSTLAPFRLMNPPPGAAYRPTDIGPIIVTEPRVLATTEVARFVGENMVFNHDMETCSLHVGPGYPVGYQCKGEKVWDESCQLIYVTDGTFLNWIADGRLRDFSVVVIDEAHERSENIDTILTLLREKLHSYPDLRVVIASATIEVQYFMQYFDGAADGIAKLSVESKKTTNYGVPLFSDIDFTDDVLTNGLTIKDVAYPGWKSEKTDEADGRDLRAETKAMLGLRAAPLPTMDGWRSKAWEASVDQAFRLAEAVDGGKIPHGDIIAFLPTKKDCTNAYKEMLERLKGVEWRAAVYWLMSEATDQMKKSATAECEPGKFKIVFASNIAETSLTIKGLRYVIDAGLANQEAWHSDTVRSSMSVVPHSRSGIRQRWGRVGRKADGWIFPLYTCRQFEEFPADTPAGSTTTNLERTILNLARAGVRDIRKVRFPADFSTSLRDAHGERLAAGFTREAERARASLKAGGAVNDAGDLTPFGSELAKSRLSSEQTTALLFADRLACVFETAVFLVAFGAGKLVGEKRILRFDFSWPTYWKVHARRCHEALAVGCDDDLDFLLRVLERWENAPDPEAWADQWWLDNSALCELRDQAQKLVRMFTPGKTEEVWRAVDSGLAARARAVLSRSLSSLRFIRDADGWRASDEENVRVELPLEQLVEPSSDRVIAVHRDRPQATKGAHNSGLPILRGVANVLDWACDPSLDAFDLMIEASSRLRSGKSESRRHSMLASVSGAYPIGTILETDGFDLSTAWLLRAGPGFSEADPRTKDRGDDHGASSPYRIDTGNKSEANARIGRRKRVAGTETPPEESRGQPRNIEELESPIPVVPRESSPKDVGLRGRRPSEDASGSGETPRATLLIDDDRVVSDGSLARVTGYRIGPDGLPIVVAEPVSETASARLMPTIHDDVEPGETLRVRASGLVRDHYAMYRVLHRLENGTRSATGYFYYDGKLLDEHEVAGSDCILEGSDWNLLIGPTQDDNQRISLTADLFDRTIGPLGLKVGPGDANSEFVGGVVRAVRVENFKQDEFFVVELTGNSIPSHLVRVLVPMRHALELPNKRVEVGQWVQFKIQVKLKGHRSGSWDPKDVATILHEQAGRFEAYKASDKVFNLKGGRPLDAEGLRYLLEIDPGNEQYLANALELWNSGRRIGPSKYPKLQLLSSTTSSGPLPPTFPPKAPIVIVDPPEPEPVGPKGGIGTEPRPRGGLGVGEKRPGPSAGTPPPPPGPPRSKPPLAPPVHRPGTTSQPRAGAGSDPAPEPKRSGAKQPDSRNVRPRGNGPSREPQKPQRRRGRVRRWLSTPQGGTLIMFLVLFVLTAGVCIWITSLRVDNILDASARDIEIVDSDISGGWAVQLASDPAGSGTNDDVAYEHYQVLHQQYNALVVPSDKFVGMLKGRWVMLGPDRFETSEAALDWCRARSMSFDQCFAHHVTHDEKEYQGEAYN